jgi:hypothetical protein
MSDVTVASEAPASAPAPTIDVNPPPAGTPPATEAAPSIDDTLAKAWDDSQRETPERNERGQFVSKSGSGKEPPADDKTDPAVQPPDKAPEPAKLPVIDVPNSWTAEARAHWAKLPPEAQAYIAQRESEAHKAITSQGERLKSYEPLEQVITYFKDDIARRGIQPAQSFAALLHAQRQLDADPIEGLIGIARTYGYDLRALLQGQQQLAPTPVDPRIGQLEQRLGQAEQNYQRQQEAASQRERAEINATLTEFAKDKPHFESVRTLMASFLYDDHATTLQEAYDMAVNASPAIRQRIQTDQRKADEEKREQELKAKAAGALKSAKVNVRSGTAHPNPKTMDDTIDEIARRAYG